jgi:hypothetical protein
MVNTVGEAVRKMIEDAMYGALLDSPRFSDYKIYQVSVPSTGVEEAIDKAVANAVKGAGGKSKTEGGDGEFENILANIINDDNNAYSDAELTEDELANLGDNTPSLMPSEEGAVGAVKGTIGLAQNPMSIVAPLMGMLPHAALIALAISLVPLMIDELKKPGSMMDVRFKRLMTDEFNAFLDRQSQWEAQIGLRNVYVQSHNGFLMANGAAHSESNLRRVRENIDRTAQIDFVDHAKELFR